MIKKIGGKIAFYPIALLQNLGEAAVSVIVYIIKNFFSFIKLTIKYVWDKTVRLRLTVFSFLQYLIILVISPFVKLWHDFDGMSGEIRDKRREKGFFGALWVSVRYFFKIIVGRRGLGVTAFNLIAPVLSVVFLFNVVAYATSATYALKLTVNGEFLGYVESEQAFLEAEDIVLQKISYVGSDKSIEVSPEYSIERIGSSETLTKNQVANLILKNSGFELESAYGVYIDGQFLGAVLDNTAIEKTVNNLLDNYRSGADDEEIMFLNNVEWRKSDLYLEESLVDPKVITKLITKTKTAAAYYTVEEGDSPSLVADKLDMTVEELEKMNPGFAETDLHVGDLIKRTVEEPYLPVSVTRTEEYDEYVPFETEYQDDPTHYVGYLRVTRNGEEGVNHVTARVAYVNEEEISRVPVQVVKVSDPVTKIISRGTMALPKGQVSTQYVEYGKFIWPTLSNGYISCNYGRDGYRFHSGIDIAGVGYGAPIFAGENGVVTFSGNRGDGYGNYVIIQHDNGLSTLYGHCSSLGVRVGDKVIQGQQIANVGSTGQSTGNHLHFEVIQGKSSRLNPNNYLD